VGVATMGAPLTFVGNYNVRLHGEFWRTGRGPWLGYSESRTVDYLVWKLSHSHTAKDGLKWPATCFVRMWVQLRLLNPRLTNAHPRQWGHSRRTSW
jgi:hypothetical protein